MRSIRARIDPVVIVRDYTRYEKMNDIVRGPPAALGNNKLDDVLHYLK